MLTIILAESELELMPESLRANPRIIESAGKRRKKPEEIILDSSTHHAVMGGLHEQERRGRPDIAHLFLLVSLESILNKQGKLRVIIHTRNDDMITINPETRMIKNYDRFLGLMGQLFQKNIVPDETQPLLQLKKNVTLSELLKELKSDFRIVCSATGTPVKLPQYFTELKKKKHNDIVCVIGGFPKGEFHSNISEIADEVISIYPEMVLAWTVAGEILVNYENVFL